MFGGDAPRRKSASAIIATSLQYISVHLCTAAAHVSNIQQSVNVQSSGLPWTHPCYALSRFQEFKKCNLIISFKRPFILLVVFMDTLHVLCSVSVFAILDVSFVYSFSPACTVVWESSSAGSLLGQDVSVDGCVSCSI